MENEKQSETTKSRGGHRPGSGRKAGSTQKISAKQILETAQQVIGKPLVVSILEGYRDSIHNDDVKTRTIYEKMLLDKTAATILDVEVDDNSELVSAKQLAFAEAIKQIINKDKDNDNASN